MNYILILSGLFLVIAILSSGYKERGGFKSLFKSVTIFIFFVITIIYLNANYFTNDGVTEDVVLTLLYGLGGAGFGEYKFLIIASVLSLILSLVFGYFYYKYLRKIKKIPHSKKVFIHNIFLILAFLTHPFVANIYKIYNDNTQKARDDFHKFYKIPTKDETHNGFNLVYIYAESLERTYFDKSVFPNLMTDLGEIKDKSIDFSNIHQMVGGGNTISGMISSQCGVPLFAPFHANGSSGMKNFYGGAKCFGDVLSESGYHLTYMQGASLNFGGKDNFYKTHKFNEIIGKKELRKSLDNKKYLNGWGLYDDSALDLSYQKFEELSEKKQNFAFLLLTLDTHHPNGHPSKSCDDRKYGDGKNKILNAVKCSDYLISKFIKKIQNSPYGKNTIIALSSDHLAMKNTATNILKKQNRRNLFLIFDPRKDDYQNIDKNGSTLDIGSTLLDRLDINSSIGLGKNLFKENSLYSAKLNQQLQGWRKDILKFWQFAKIKDSYEVNLVEKNIKIGSKIYDFPSIIRITENNLTNPIFSFNGSKKLAYHIPLFDKSQKFIWIDKCEKMNEIFEKNYEQKTCISQGTLMGDIEIFPLDTNLTKISTKNLFNDSKFFYEDNLYKKRVYNIFNFLNIKEDIHINFLYPKYPKIVKFVKGLSVIEGFGRWSDGEKIEIRFRKQLPKNFKMTLVARAFETNINKPVKIIIGKTVKYFTIKDKNLNHYEINFNCPSSSDRIYIIPPTPTSPNELNGGADMRKLGIGLGILNIESKINNTLKKNKTKLIELYLAVLKRVPDKAGFDYWLGEIEYGNMLIEDIADIFFQGIEAQGKYPNTLSNEDFMDKIYLNLIDRKPIEAEKDYWKTKIDNKDIPKNKFIFFLIDKIKVNGDKDYELLKNKILISRYFAIELGLNDAKKAKNILKNITSETQSVINAKLLLK